MNQPLQNHEFRAELIQDEDGPAVMIDQADANGDGEHSVILHPHQLRAICEHFGILPADEQASKTIASLQRRMLALRDRIDQLGDALLNNNDHAHVDLDHELSLVTALDDLAREWCKDFDPPPPPAPDKAAATVPSTNAAAQSAAQAAAQQPTLI